MGKHTIRSAAGSIAFRPKSIASRSLYDAQLFANIELGEQTQALIAENPQGGEALVRLNRCLLADVYPRMAFSAELPKGPTDKTSP